MERKLEADALGQMANDINVYRISRALKLP